MESLYNVLKKKQGSCDCVIYYFEVARSRFQDSFVKKMSFCIEDRFCGIRVFVTDFVVYENLFVFFVNDPSTSFQCTM